MATEFFEEQNNENVIVRNTLETNSGKSGKLIQLVQRIPGITNEKRAHYFLIVALIGILITAGMSVKHTFFPTHQKIDIFEKIQADHQKDEIQQ
jgi:hypothetical protein